MKILGSAILCVFAKNVADKIELNLYILIYTMETIVSFSFPEVVCRFSLNRRGPRKYGTLSDLLASGTGIPSTVGMPNGDEVIRNDIRISTRFTSVIDFDIEELDPDIVEEHLIKLSPDNSTIYWPYSDRYSVIEYGPGGFFSEHQDKKQKKNHIATLLIFPPAVGTLEHTGGELILDRGRFRFNSSSNMEWAFVAFHTGLPHECLAVLSGRRVVFKTELYSSKPVEHIPGDEYRNMIVDGSLRFID